MTDGGREHEVARRLREASETLAVVETSAGGLVSARLTAIPGSSAWFSGGAVAYSAAARLTWLGLSDVATRAAGVVSADTALALARAARESLGTAWGAAETGIAGPQTGRRSAKPVGLAYVAVVGGAVERVLEVSTGQDDREANREAFAEALLGLLLEVLA